MGAASLQSNSEPAALLPFRAVLTPHRSLGPVGFLVLIGGVAVVSFVTGIAFLLIGAWPVTAFFGLDVFLIWWAFRLNYRSARHGEVIEIDGRRLVLTRHHLKGGAETIELNPYWVTVRLSAGHDDRTALTLGSHGREYVLASFLSDDERRELADVLGNVLRAARQGPVT